MENHLHLLDFLAIAIYLMVVFCIGLYMARRQKTTLDYFIANRRVPAWAVGFTLMATMISSVTFVGHSGAAFGKNFYIQVTSFAVPIVLVFVFLFIVPFYRHVVRMSAYEYMERRFGYGARLYSSFGFVVLRVVDLGFTMYLTAIAVNVMTGWDMMWVVICLGLFTMVYTIIGGIEGVIWTDVIQGFILIFGALAILLMVLFTPAQGPTAVIATAWEGGKFSFGDFDATWDSFYKGTPTAWMFFFSALMQFGRMYITEQNMVQRYLVARTDREAQQGVALGALLCVPIWLTFAFIGVSIWAYFKVTAETIPPEILARPDDILPYFVATRMPIGVVGVILAAILAAAQSSVSADLNSMSTVVTTDYFERFIPRTSDKMRLAFGRFIVLIGGLLTTGVALALSTTRGTAALETGATLASVIGGGLLGLFGLGFLTRRATRSGAYFAIIVCLIFTGWATLTGPLREKIGMAADDQWYTFNMHPIMIGIFGHFLLFGAGYLYSRLLGGHRPEDIAKLTIRQAFGRKSKAASTAAPSED